MKLSAIATLRFGIHAKPLGKGDVKYLQGKHFDDSGTFIRCDAYLNAKDQKSTHFLQDGDVLFIGKGYRNFAWTYRSATTGAAIASSLFYIIRVDPSLVLPDFLRISLNAEKYQARFKVMGVGSAILSIRRSELEALKIELPNLKTQEEIIALEVLHQKDIAISEDIINQKKKRHTSIIHHLLHQ